MSQRTMFGEPEPKVAPEPPRPAAPPPPPKPIPRPPPPPPPPPPVVEGILAAPVETAVVIQEMADVVTRVEVVVFTEHRMQPTPDDGKDHLVDEQARVALCGLASEGWMHGREPREYCPGCRQKAQEKYWST